MEIDIAIIGSGITGLSTAYHLDKRGIERYLVLDRMTGSASAEAPGLVMGGLQDAFTRLSHAYGLTLAKEIWEFSDEALRALRAFLHEQGISYGDLSQLRLFTSEQELLEASVAEREFSEASYDCPVKKGSQAFGTKVLGTQKGTERAMWVETTRLLGALQTDRVKRAEVSELSWDGDRVIVKTSQGVYRATMAILCCHTGIARLVPSLADVLIPYVDQWIEFMLDDSSAELDSMMFLAQFGYVWGALHERRLLLGGGRFLRKWAGIGEDQKQPLEAIDQFLAEEAARLFPSLKWGKKPLRKASQVGIRPCDEIPLFGPLPGRDQILVASGYMGFGLHLGFYGGKVLSDMVAQGYCRDLPTKLHTRRIRSLES